MSFTFGANVVTKFLEKHEFDLIVRAHQVVEEGYEFFAKRQLVTVFSAPNYCMLAVYDAYEYVGGEFDNAGAMMTVDENLMCSFQILRPADKKIKYPYPGAATGNPMASAAGQPKPGAPRPATPPRNKKKIDPKTNPLAR